MKQVGVQRSLNFPAQANRHICHQTFLEHGLGECRPPTAEQRNAVAELRIKHSATRCKSRTVLPSEEIHEEVASIAARISKPITCVGSCTRDVICGTLAPVHHCIASARNGHSRNGYAGARSDDAG